MGSYNKKGSTIKTCSGSDFNMVLGYTGNTGREV